MKDEIWSSDKRMVKGRGKKTATASCEHWSRRCLEKQRSVTAGSSTHLGPAVEILQVSVACFPQGVSQPCQVIPGAPGREDHTCCPLLLPGARHGALTAPLDPRSSPGAAPLPGSAHQLLHSRLILYHWHIGAFGGILLEIQARGGLCRLLAVVGGRGEGEVFEGFFWGFQKPHSSPPRGGVVVVLECQKTWSFLLNSSVPVQAGILEGLSSLWGLLEEKSHRWCWKRGVKMHLFVIFYGLTKGICGSEIHWSWFCPPQPQILSSSTHCHTKSSKVMQNYEQVLKKYINIALRNAWFTKYKNSTLHWFTGLKAENNCSGIPPLGLPPPFPGEWETSYHKNANGVKSLE